LLVSWWNWEKTWLQFENISKRTDEKIYKISIWSKKIEKQLDSVLEKLVQCGN